MDHRRIQRTLFRMQHDPGFAARLRAGDADARATTGLGEPELALLCATDPRAVSADREGRRRAQLLRNLAGEMPLSVASGPAGDGDTAWVEAFPTTRWFHAAVSGDTRLPLAFAAHAGEVAVEAPDTAFRALVALESALVRLRRQPVAPNAEPALPPGSVRRAATAQLLDLPAGTFARASALRGRLDRGLPAQDPELPPVADSERERVLVCVRVPAAPGAVAELAVEALPPLVADLLAQAARPLDPAARQQFAARHEINAGDVESVVAEYVAEGVLRAG